MNTNPGKSQDSTIEAGDRDTDQGTDSVALVKMRGGLSPMSTMNYYVVLGIAEDADGDTIRSAFRALARRYHPDAGSGSSVAEFRRALEAYATLSDPER